jgi:hypothetical protein
MSEVTVSRGSTTRPLGSISDGTDKAPGPIDRMASALASPGWVPNRTQVAQLIAAAMASGYEQGREAGLAEAWQHVFDTPEAPPFSAAQLIAAEQVQRHRAKYDAWAAVPHRRDHRGGPVAVWE